MEIDKKAVPRRFRVGAEGRIVLSDCGSIRLEADEMITFATPSGRQFDFTAKSWGFYATPSLNGRLRDQGFKTALVKNSQGRLYVMAVEADRVAEFQAYLAEDRQALVEWLDEREP